MHLVCYSGNHYDVSASGMIAVNNVMNCHAVIRNFFRSLQTFQYYTKENRIGETGASCYRDRLLHIDGEIADCSSMRIVRDTDKNHFLYI